MLYGIYCYIFIENFPQKFSPCGEIINENIYDEFFKDVRYDTYIINQ